jgi:hypothetical protein
MLSEYQFWVYLASGFTRDAIKIDCIKDNQKWVDSYILTLNSSYAQ